MRSDTRQRRLTSRRLLVDSDSVEPADRVRAHDGDEIHRALRAEQLLRLRERRRAHLAIAQQLTAEPDDGRIGVAQPRQRAIALDDVDDLLDEHEQGERVRAWLRNNALGIVGGVALGIALIYGWRWWQDQQAQQQQKAHTAYAQAVEQLEAGAVDKAGALLAGQEGAYATLAALRVAKAQVEAEKQSLTPPKK